MSPLDFDCKCAFHIKRREELLERIAEIEHEQWSAWARAQMTNPQVVISPTKQLAWKKFLVPYSELDEASKELDRVWARRVLAIFEE